MDDDSAYRSQDLAEIYEAVYADVGDAPFWAAMARAAGQGSLLELACGAGRVLLPLARAGYEITGLDLSAAMLARCRVNLEAEPAETRCRVRLLEADMASFDLGRRFGAIFCAFNSFHHLRTVEDQLSCLECCRKHLLPGGILVLDLCNPDPAPAGASDDEALGADGRSGPEADGRSGPEADGRSGPEADAGAQVVQLPDGRRVRRWMSACVYIRSSQTNECEITNEVIEADGTRRTLVETFPLRLMYRYELEHLLARCGFRIAALYGGYDREPFTEESVGMIVVAETFA